jgi:hypothetical protein
MHGQVLRDAATRDDFWRFVREHASPAAAPSPATPN